jgi:hypothetical protein
VIKENRGRNQAGLASKVGRSGALFLLWAQARCLFVSHDLMARGDGEMVKSEGHKRKSQQIWALQV